MSNIHSTRHVCLVIPPHMSDHAAQNGDPQLRRIMRNTRDESREIEMRRRRESLEQHEKRGRDARAPWSMAALRSVEPAKNRHVYDAQHRRTTPGKLVLIEGGARSTDVEVNEAYDGAGATYDLFLGEYGRDSIDGKGLRIDSTVHYGSHFDNAMWDGKQMVYGDGDGKLFNRFTSCVDVIGHEITHGITQYTAALGYTGQTGALNEHVSDAFGAMVKQRLLRQTAAQADWLIGAGLLASGVKGKAIRSMAAPGTAYDDPQLGKDPQPAHMRDYVRTADDNGGVHINSGIPNHAFYLAATASGGYAWEGAGKVWYETLKTRATPNAKFIHFAKDTVVVAARIFGPGSKVHRAVADGWTQVGVNVTASNLGRPTLLRLVRTAPPADGSIEKKAA